ncbi:TetR/AcrR family transcriptional regulator [Amycolatopsis echigonensis]|uniref:TetR/AcrR family transcriptional regulator n=1 Tax=Amycolatopsis echigonensis TaxID=2576905 RepID=UPI001FC9925E|nr:MULTISPECIES: helix-turn-helix domain-containing protein [Amycolatopsis]
MSRRQLAAKRRVILDAAAGCFARDGFEKTSTADICRAAGISSGSLFHYFPSKRAVFVGIFEADNADNEELLATAVEMADPWVGVLADPRQ